MIILINKRNEMVKIDFYELAVKIAEIAEDKKALD
jgi:hypothetical protein